MIGLRRFSSTRHTRPGTAHQVMTQAAHNSLDRQAYKQAWRVLPSPASKPPHRRFVGMRHGRSLSSSARRSLEGCSATPILRQFSRQRLKAGPFALVSRAFTGTRWCQLAIQKFQYLSSITRIGILSNSLQAHRVSGCRQPKDAYEAYRNTLQTIHRGNYCKSNTRRHRAVQSSLF